MSGGAIHEGRLAEILGAEGPASPGEGLVARIMDGIPGADGEPRESAFDRWNRVALPVAIAAALAASLLVVLTSRAPAPADPVGAITAEPGDGLDELLTISKR